MYKISAYLDQDHRRCRSSGMSSELFDITSKREGVRVHRLIDDTHYPTRTRQPAIRRDPMVAALFGAAPASPAAEPRVQRLNLGAPSTSMR